jgi:hypothetical protein
MQCFSYSRREILGTAGRSYPERNAEVSRFQSFKVSKFQGFKVKSRSNSRVPHLRAVLSGAKMGSGTDILYAT